MGPPRLDGPRDGNPSIADSGTNGDVFMSSPAPFTATGVLLQSKPSWPYIVAKTGTADPWSSFIVVNSANTELLRVTSDGRVAIGTVNPQTMFHIAGAQGTQFVDGATAAVTASPEIRLRRARGNPGAETGSVAGDRLGMFGAGGYAAGAYTNARAAVAMFAAETFTSTAHGTYIALETTPSGATARAERMRVDASGNVGIGTTAPTAKLHVVGNAHFQGTVTGTYIQAHYQDVAEWVPSNEDLAPGTVVVLDPAIGNGVRASATSYDTSVAGVVSVQPGIVLGEGSSTKEMIATTGRVRVKVDASRAAIAVGDLLVTSDRSGVAMKSEALEIQGRKFHQPGTIIGKALEPLSGGQSEILVLLSLQ